MMLVKIDLRAHLRERQSSIKVRFDVAAKAPHHFDLWMTNSVLRLTAAAGAITRMLGGLGQREKFNLMTLGPPRRARWAAVDASRAHRIDESSIKASVSRQDR